MQRRGFITLFAGVILAPRAACAQQLGIPVIGYLTPQTRLDRQELDAELLEDTRGSIGRSNDNAQDTKRTN